jgi:predicted HD phosphohydrolase
VQRLCSAGGGLTYRYDTWQCGEMAARAGFDEEVVVAALLHGLNFCCFPLPFCQCLMFD